MNNDKRDDLFPFAPGRLVGQNRLYNFHQCDKVTQQIITIVDRAIIKMINDNRDN